MTLQELKMKGLIGWTLEQGRVEGGMVFFLLAFLLAGIVGYLLGSINCGLLVSSLGYKDDIRKHGSGNAGMTNVMRTYGKKAALITLLGDAAKGALAVAFGFLCCGTYSAYFAAFFCVVGHAYPIYFGFRGGKGVVVTAVTLLCLNPLLFLILFVIFAIIVIGTRYISLGSVMCMLIYPLLLSSLGGVLDSTVTDTTEFLGFAMEGGRNFTVIMAFCNAAFVIWLHRSNIKRLMEGTENKFSFKKSVKPGEAATSEETQDAENEEIHGPSQPRSKKNQKKDKKKESKD